MELKKLSKITKYQNKLKKLLNEDLIDIILFGSFVRGGSAKDIDTALIVKKRTGLSETKKKIKNIFKKEVDFQIIDIRSIYSPIWLTLIKEGFSILKNKYLSDIYRIKPMVLYKYSLKKLNNVKKVQFERGIKKVLGKKGIFLTRSVVIIPLTIKNEMIEFLKTWNIYYESQEYELLPILRKENFF